MCIFVANASRSIAAILYRRGKSGQHRASRFLTGRGLGVNTRIMESAAESIPPMAFKHR